MGSPPPIHRLNSLARLCARRSGRASVHQLRRSAQPEYGYGSAPTCEGARSIDLAWLRRRGMLTPGRYSVTWSQGDKPSGSISIVTQVDGVRLLYWVTDADGARTHVDELVPFRSTATRFGGYRKWFMCLKCRRRRRQMFGGRYFRCRQCHGLTYASQRENPTHRAMQRADRIANRLHDMWKGTTKDAGEFPPKPPRMRWRTYERLERQYDELQHRWTTGMWQFIGRLRQR